MNILTIRELKDKGIEPEILFWVGCADPLMIEQKNY